MIDATEILQGKHDSDLELIETACRQRRKILREIDAAIIMAVVKVGGTVRIKDIRPKYLIGATAKVVRKRGTKLEIEFSKSYGRYKSGYTVTVPSSCVEIIQSEE